MSDDYRKMNEQYNKFDTEHANGLLFLFFIWLIAANPMGIALLSFPMCRFYSIYLPKIGYNWITIPVIIAMICTGVFILSSIILGIKIYNLKLTAWKLIKYYYPALQIFLFILIIPAFFILPHLNSTEIFTHPEEQIRSYFRNFIFNLITSTVISLSWLLYCIKSKKAPKQFLDNKK